MENIETAAPSETVETPIAEQAVTTENAAPSEEHVETKPEKTFTQSELNEIVQKRLDRDRESVSKKAAQEARDAYIAEQNYEWQGKPIKTEAEYKQALTEKALIEKYQEQGLPDEFVNEMVENKRFRQEYENDRKKTESEQKQQAEFKAFLDAFPDIKPDEIPPGVWEEVNKGTRLVDAYARHENKLLKDKLAEIEQGKQIEQQNELNAASSTGSVTGQGEGKPAFFTREQVKGMSQSETNKNWDAIQASMKQWT
ncbi:hypothetical protein B1748_23540 [Paenibacillus sp. MY03]|uniref:hypothetical protein n=1 Tax=Paenibacillus sp. MY03 TaxID=302980 RepID=UPI000B3D4185|nr:hypothetical protein [Paenibacillus sp. MY03]OUS72985.1 hypothetical protein B1748_23540 [Paenibacillus sp. MY03]